MSFILDSLRKSENARQQSTGPGITEVRTATTSQGNRPMFFWVIGLLALNLLVLLGFVFWPSKEEPVQNVSVPVPADTAQRFNRSSGAPASAARPEVRSLAGEAGSANPTASAPPPVQANVPTSNNPETFQPAATVAETPSTRAPILPNRNAVLPTIYELQANGSLNVSELHLDMHMFHENPSRRFVFINSKKYKEGEKLSEGPLLEEIQNDAVVFYFDGQRFTLPRN